LVMSATIRVTEYVSRKLGTDVVFVIYLILV
jgi:hypothetical protein